MIDTVTMQELLPNKASEERLHLFHGVRFVARALSPSSLRVL